MKLTEQQLAQLFKSSKNAEIDSNVDDLYASTDASDIRLASVEKIANNSTLSASYHIINQLHDWSDAIGNDLDLSLKPRFSSVFASWFKPLVGAAAVVTAVYFVTPQMDQQTKSLQQPDRITFSAGFEGNNDTIRTTSFESKTTNSQKSDVISKSQFG